MSVDTSEGWGNEVIDSKDRAKVDRPNQDAETAARRMAAEKMGLVKDTHGLRLPEDLWRQMMPAAEAYLEELEENEMPDDLTHWTEHARRDDWYTYFVGSDIRCMLGEIERLRAECASLREANNTWVALHGPAQHD